ncbi:MAG: tRNA (adenosine(37)-N6)-dimethylallyltransferase MiaA [Clostridia bacterium]|nr:tRNA (adenosine(37)-N6)-dimethylallyltransferase MiaA [Clostridia bacterium]
MNRILYIIGPTASGKTELAIDVCKRINGEIIGADSMQIYKHISVGTAKPTTEETGDIKYHLIDFVEPDIIYTVSQFKDDALELIEDMHKRGVIPVVCGGTGLYINSLLYKMDFTEASYDLALRQELDGKSREELLLMLNKLDGKTYEEIDKSNLRRVRRAIEICMLSGKPKSQQTNDYKKSLRPFDHRVIVLNPDRKVLYERINKRVDIMLENGLVEEVKLLLEKYPKRDYPVFQFIGYKEIVEYLSGESDLITAAEKIKQNTRHFAKRQMTWFRGLKGIENLHFLNTACGKEELLDKALKILE